MADIVTGAGVLMYRRRDGKLEVFLGHYGGPYFAKKDIGAWSFPKGHAEAGEDLLATAKREYKEETGFDIPEGTKFTKIGTSERSGKVVHVWAFEGDCDPKKMVSNTCMVEWPPRSGKQIEIPEVDRGDFFTLEVARTKLSGYMSAIIDEFEKIIT